MKQDIEQRIELLDIKAKKWLKLDQGHLGQAPEMVLDLFLTSL